MRRAARACGADFGSNNVLIGKCRHGRRAAIRFVILNLQGTESLEPRLHYMTKANENITDRTVETPEDARQGERKKGMPTVLGISTAIAILALAAVFAISLA